MEIRALSIDIAVVIELFENPLKIHLKKGETKRISLLIMTIDSRKFIRKKIEN